MNDLESVVVMELIYTVNPGIEDIAAEEIKAELGGNVEYSRLSGHIYHKLEYDLSWEAIYRLRSINRAFLLMWKGLIGKKHEDLLKLRNEIIEGLKDIHYYVTPYTTFAVDTERVGEHEFTSIDVSRLVGELVIRIVESKTGRKPVVNLRTPNVIVHVFVKDNKIYIGVSLTGPWSMHRRGYRIYDHPAALKPTLAYAMLTISGTRDKDVIVDPMCGGGTIPIEAALIHEDAHIYGYDQNPRHIRGAKMNAYAAGVYKRVFFGVWDATRLNEVIDNVDHIISNPPYGIRYGDPSSIRKLYNKFLEASYKALREGGHLTIITTEYNYVYKIAKRTGFKIIHERVVYHGSLYPRIMVLEK